MREVSDRSFPSQVKYPSTEGTLRWNVQLCAIATREGPGHSTTDRRKNWKVRFNYGTGLAFLTVLVHLVHFSSQQVPRVILDFAKWRSVQDATNASICATRN